MNVLIWTRHHEHSSALAKVKYQQTPDVFKREFDKCLKLAPDQLGCDAYVELHATSTNNFGD